MKSLIKIELKRAFINPFFLIALCIGCGISISQFASLTLKNPLVGDYTDIVGLEPPSLFNKMIGLEDSSIQTAVFYYMLPIIAALPFADSLFKDIKSGYIKNVFIRTKKVNYYTAKYIAVFLSAAVSVATPLLLNLFLTSAFVPATIPEPNSGLFMLRGNSMWGELFFTSPCAYVLLYILLDAIFGGLWACVAIGMSYIVSNRFVALISPFIICIFTHAVAMLLNLAHFDILTFLRLGQGMVGLRFIHVFICMTILCVVPLSVYIYRGKHDETF